MQLFDELSICVDKGQVACGENNRSSLFFIYVCKGLEHN